MDKYFGRRAARAVDRAKDAFRMRIPLNVSAGAIIPKKPVEKSPAA
jgi:hypothetical protein